MGYYSTVYSFLSLVAGRTNDRSSLSADSWRGKPIAETTIAENNDEEEQ